MDVRVGLQRKLSAKELMLLNRGVGEVPRTLISTLTSMTLTITVSSMWLIQKTVP